MITTPQLVGSCAVGANSGASPMKNSATAVLATAATAGKSPLAEGGTSSGGILSELR